MFKSILVLESPWDSESVESKSVWPFVSEFAKVMNLRAYHQIFSDRDSFMHWIEVFNKEPVKSKLLYIASHGSNGRIQGLQRDINCSTIIDTIKKTKDIKCVHFGSCLFGTENNLSLLLKQAKHLTWAAGYNQAVDWLDSTLFDIMLWHHIANPHRGGFKFHTRAEKVMDVGLAEILGFRFQYRRGDAIWSLWREPGDSD